MSNKDKPHLAIKLMNGTFVIEYLGEDMKWWHTDAVGIKIKYNDGSRIFWPWHVVENYLIVPRENKAPDPIFTDSENMRLTSDYRYATDTP